MVYASQIMAEYKVGSAGVIKITARTWEDLKSGVDDTLRRYPFNPYGTFVESIGKADGEFFAYIKHFGGE